MIMMRITCDICGKEMTARGWRLEKPGAPIGTMDVCEECVIALRNRADAYKEGYEDGYDQGCMDMTDDDLGTEEEEPA